ncbi:putative harbinger transposase-derived protein [Helianthus annuus]|uniref:Harbinger transposase-derived protein n=1 Tax=Helianthus annuus TaxID=4232 RepID=A0A9K3IGZ0_HELAN|nr:putative harbinger transposase-derived protein [Helianthus annuus]KAJ0548216.1 putative harbinger transposase-derived protein [Helianthus annuus]KAJ0954690.1 putative harbinger transposase-derived protein [Helianthus annuus]
MSSSSYSESSSSSDDGAEIFLQTIAAVVKAIVEDEDDEEETQQPKRRRRYIARERHTAKDLLVSDYFSAEPKYDEKMFRRRFRMSKNLFLRISRDLEEKYDYFKQKPDVTGQLGFSTWQKVTAALRQLAYGNSSDIMDDYLKMSARVARETLHNFCSCILELYKKRYLRKPSFSDMQQILEHHADYHGLPGMIGSLDCMKWPWELCPTQWQGAHTSGFHGVPAIMLEAVASQDLWIWHAFFGMPGSHNDITILHHSPLFNDRVNGIGPKGSFFVNGVEYAYGYYLVDGIYPEWGVFVKSFTKHGTTDPKRLKFNRVQMAARKDVERAFGVLKKRWRILGIPCRLWDKDQIGNVMYTCIILHNMILEDEGRAVVTYYDDDDPQPGNVTDEDKAENEYLIKSRDIHQNLRADLVEHVTTIPGFETDEDDE